MVSPVILLFRAVYFHLIFNVFIQLTKGQNSSDGNQLFTNTRLYVNRDGEDIKCECGISSVNRIIGGHETTPHRFPWMAFLRIFKDGTTYQCGGFLATNSHIITAAHCTKGAAANAITVILGAHNINNPEWGSVSINSSAIRIHPSYEAFGNNEDISVITLQTSVKFSPMIRPLCLPKGKGNYTGRIASIAGWGTLSEGGSASSVLQEAEVPIWDQEECKQTYAKRGITITENMICAGGKTMDTCQGDSGGPLMLENNGKFTAIGIVSFGIGCARPNLPGVYSRLDHLMEFVNSVIGNTQICP